MILKKQGLLCSSFATLQHSQYSTTKSSTSCRHPPYQTSLQHPQQQRWYAHVSDGQKPQKEEQETPWPEPIPPLQHPTPYQVLGVQKHEAYCKTAFLKLVKTYHPDRTQHDLLCPHHIRGVPPHVRLERYRLIIAAHTLLSDPSRKSEYDRYGTGWTGNPSADNQVYDRPRWKPGESPMNNATWEDWERWHSRGDQPQAPVYVSNAMFVSVIVILATLGGIGEATRAKKWSASFLEQRDIADAAARQELQKAREAASAAGNHKGRIEAFLRHKNSTAQANESYRRTMPLAEVDSSNDVASGKEL